ncbi:MAG: radical SAM protein [Actinobacteria bacterium]|nr:radical SAM protein [Actinomycetota bacterium]
MNPTITQDVAERALERAADGHRLDAGEIIALYDLPFERIAPVAHAARCRVSDPKTVTFSVGGNIDYTSICNVACKFCLFYRTPKQEGAFALTTEQVLAALDRQVEFGVNEVMVQGGVNPAIPYEWYVETMRAMKEAHPQLFIEFLSPEEILGLEKLTGREASEILAELHAAGMDGLPGSATDILDPDVRARTAPARISVEDWLRIVDAAQTKGMVVNWTGLVFGLDETPEQRVRHLMTLRDQQDRDLERGGSGFGLYKVWAMRLTGSRLDGKVDIPPAQTTNRRYLKELAIHRLALDNVQTQQAVWRTAGFEIAKTGLQSGADDLCGTGSLNAVNATLQTAGKHLPDPDANMVAEIVDAIHQAGFDAVERDGRFKKLRVFERERQESTIDQEARR